MPVTVASANTQLGTNIYTVPEHVLDRGRCSIALGSGGSIDNSSSSSNSRLVVVPERADVNRTRAFGRSHSELLWSMRHDVRRTLN